MINIADLLMEDNHATTRKEEDRKSPLVDYSDNHVEIADDNIQESYVFSKSDIYINYEKFQTNKSNICLITGLSGSGKTTLAEKIAKEYDAELIELDVFEHCYGYTDEQLKKAGQVFYDYLSSHKSVWEDLKKKAITGKELGKEINKFVHYCISWCVKDKSNKYVIEGVQIYSFMLYKEIKAYPLIIKNTSMIKSIIQRWKRNGGGKIDIVAELKNEFPQLVAWYKDEEKSLKNFKKAIKDYILNESKLSSKDRNELDNNEFGIPEDRKFPLNDKNHVEQAIRMFGKADEDKKKSLAKRISKKAKEYNIDISNTKVSEYINETVETRLTKPFIGKKITLYHGSSEKLDVISPITADAINKKKTINGINLGTRFSKPRYSSFWCDNDVFPKIFTFHREVVNRLMEKENNKEYRDVIIKYFRGDYVKEKFYIRNSDKSEILKIFKSIKIYIHKVTIDSKIVGRGHHKVNDEYSLDIPVKPDEIYDVDWNDKDIQNVYNFIDDNRFDSIDPCEMFNSKYDDKPKRGWNIMYDLVYHDSDELKTIKKSIKKLKYYSNNIDSITEASKRTDLYPIYIVTSYTNTVFGKIVRKATDSTYTHAAISFEPDLQQMYSFGNSGNLSNSKWGGMTCESLQDYLNTSKDAKILVSVVFVKEKDYHKLVSFFEMYLANHRDTRYDYKDLVRVLTKKVNNTKYSLYSICSQFVDSLFKYIGVDLTGIPSNLVTPKDIAELPNNKPTVYIVYEGPARLYATYKAAEKTNKLLLNAIPIKELALKEAKEFPIQFNDEGDLLISKKEKIDFLTEYNKSKKLRSSYIKYKNLEGLKYEASKLWYINTILIKLLETEKDDNKRKDLNNYRSKILTEFSQYFKDIQKLDNKFNFGSYYEQTPFSNTKIKINGSTIKYTTRILKTIFK